MAQHISIINSERKGLRKIAKSLTEKTSRGIWAVAGSLKFEELPYQEHKMNSHDRVFVTERNVNGQKEKFELHYDTKAKKILDMFLVK